MGAAAHSAAGVSDARHASFDDAVAALARALDEFGVPWMLLGGVAVIASGVARTTLDVDATLSGQRTDLDGLLATLARHAIEPRLSDALEFARRRQVLLARHTPSGVEVDVSLAWLPFEEQALAASHSQQFGDVRVRVPRPDDLLVFKLVAARPRDLDDAEKLLLLHGAQVDLRHMRAVLVEFCHALEDDERLHAFDRLLAKVGLG